MKKAVCLLLSLLMLVSLASCKTVVLPGADEAEKKMKALGYNTDSDTFEGTDLVPITQVTILKAIRDQEILNVYYFANEEDCETYFQYYKETLTSDIDRCEKYRFAIVRGTEGAFEDLFQ